MRKGMSSLEYGIDAELLAAACDGNAENSVRLSERPDLAGPTSGTDEVRDSGPARFATLDHTGPTCQTDSSDELKAENGFQCPERHGKTFSERKEKTTTSVVGQAQRPDSSELFARVISQGMAGVKPTNPDSQRRLLEQLLDLRGPDYCHEAIDGMSWLWPYSEGRPWSVSELTRHADQAVAAKRKAQRKPSAESWDRTITPERIEEVTWKR